MANVVKAVAEFAAAVGEVVEAVTEFAAAVVEVVEAVAEVGAAMVVVVELHAVGMILAVVDVVVTDCTVGGEIAKAMGVEFVLLDLDLGLGIGWA